MFWNVAGLGKKNADFWSFLRQYDVIGLTETWVESKGWEKLAKRLPKEYEWKCKAAKREKKKGRASGGIITGVRKDIVVEDNNFEFDGAVKNVVKIGDDKWVIWTATYVRNQNRGK